MALVHVRLPSLGDEHRIQGLRMLDSGRNPKTGKPLFPGMRDALLGMRPAIRSNIIRLSHPREVTP